MHKPEKKFPSYFNNFEMPEGAKEQSIIVYRACKTLHADASSFLPTFEENNYNYLAGDDPKDPGVYSLSTFEKPKDIKRFAILNDECKPRHKIAKGATEPCCGLSQRTKDRIPGYKNSHVDWWIYEDAKPYEHFELIEDFDEYYKKYKEGRA